VINNEGTHLNGSLLVHFFIWKLISANGLSVCSELKRFFF